MSQLAKTVPVETLTEVSDLVVDHADATDTSGRSRENQRRFPFVEIVSCSVVAASLWMIYVSLTTYCSGLASLGYIAAPARIKSVERHYGALGVTRAVTVEYEAQGVTHERVLPHPSGRVLKAGERTDVYVDRAAPKQVTFSREVDYDTVIVQGAFGLFFLGFAVSALFHRVRKNRASG